MEDNSDIRGLVSYLLREKGYAVIPAANGRAALQRLRRGSRPCVILLDLRMPLMTGWEFLRILQGRRRWASIPVIVMTGEPVRGQDLAGMPERLEKPIEPAALLQAVRKHCG